MSKRIVILYILEYLKFVERRMKIYEILDIYENYIFYLFVFVEENVNLYYNYVILKCKNKK